MGGDGQINQYTYDERGGARGHEEKKKARHGVVSDEGTHR